MRVLFAASEAAPFVKTGGLADVVGTLPVALKKLEVDVRVILPKYRDIPAEWKAKMQYLTHFYVSMGWRKQYCGIQFVKHENVTFYFVDNEFYFARDAVYADGPEEGERFGFFCRAVLEALPKIDFFPDVLHCNDWQTGMISVLLKLQYMHLQQYANIRTLYTIHNLKFQGVFDYKQIDDFFGLGMRYFTPEFLEFFGDISFLKGGIVFSDRVSTVSPTYAREIQSPYYGERMDGLLRQRSDTLSGILNGIDYDIWNPASDPHIAAAYDPQNIEGKAECKRRLQRELWLPEQDDVMVVALVSRLTEQKGLSLIERVLNEMMQMPIQLVVVGQGDSHFCEMFTWAQWRYQGKVAVRFEQNEWLAHNVYAGADVYLMPSRFEPCGISQLIALRYGAVPLVRETGGLMDTVESYNKYTDEGTGFSFSNYNAHEMLYTLERAYKYFLDKKLWQRLRARGMNAQFGWSQSALEYKQLYETMAGR
ncbi:glycogen synthase GlgA [Eubacteriales bacterium OttesenSCG-928-K08]|nr:glycogen synthase GlgA [Eubacteriales bacterium OttesenSCG-928-K08]